MYRMCCGHIPRVAAPLRFASANQDLRRRNGQSSPASVADGCFCRSRLKATCRECAVEECFRQRSRQAEVGQGAGREFGRNRSGFSRRDKVKDGDLVNPAPFNWNGGWVSHGQLFHPTADRRDCDRDLTVIVIVGAISSFRSHLSSPSAFFVLASLRRSDSLLWIIV